MARCSVARRHLALGRPAFVVRPLRFGGLTIDPSLDNASREAPTKPSRAVRMGRPESLDGSRSRINAIAKAEQSTLAHQASQGSNDLSSPPRRTNSRVRNTSSTLRAINASTLSHNVFGLRLRVEKCLARPHPRRVTPCRVWAPSNRLIKPSALGLGTAPRLGPRSQG